ncbi:MAG: sigma 54-interacting transcriptional regulator, partial [Planctomycetes bacterium]|nr:sigma 54-interacting transcriptional regulator [Planctomycetota bacterium]
AVTGATKEQPGLFEEAVGGTFFLDEVGDMSPSMQKKLLRVLQEGVIRRVGSKEFTPVDVRIVSATNKDLLQECKAGNFREDLYYRLNVINLVLPPLRDRREDIPDLVEYFLGSTTAGSPKPVVIEDAALELMTEYSWPGNIRELQNEILKLAALCDDNLIRAKDLSEHLRDGVNPMSSTGKKWTEGFAHMSLKEATDEFECELIRQALAKNSDNKSLVAKSLRIPKTTLYNKIKKYKL